MKTSNEYLDEISKKYGLKSDYALAKLLEVSGATMSRYRSGKTTPDNYVAAKMAQLLGKDEIELIAVATAEKAKLPKEKKFWEGMITHATLTCMFVMSGFSVTPPATEQSVTIYYVK